tara:strand:- start:242 stop:400 length:159 start_codon:yes stop_codon:yes gene_type:complete
MKVSKPVFSQSDVELLKEMIIFLVQTQDDITVPKEKKAELETLYHRLNRFKK